MLEASCRQEFWKPCSLWRAAGIFPMCCSEAAGVCHLNSEENVLFQTGHSARTKQSPQMGKGALPDFPVFWFTDTQRLDLYKLSWRFQQLKDDLELECFPLGMMGNKARFRNGKDKANVKSPLSFLFQPPAGLLQGAVWGGVLLCLYFNFHGHFTCLPFVCLIL